MCTYSDVLNKSFLDASSLFYREIMLGYYIYLDKRHTKGLVHETRLEEH